MTLIDNNERTTLPFIYAMISAMNVDLYVNMLWELDEVDKEVYCQPGRSR